MNDDPEVIVCAGPPHCPFTDEDAVHNSMDGCPMCRHIIMHPDGSETEYQIKPQ